MKRSSLCSEIAAQHRRICAAFAIMFVLFTAAAVIFLLKISGIACIIAIPPALFAGFLALRSLPLALHPERSTLFRKYGSPETVEQMLEAERGNVFFENSRMLVTQHWILKKDNPESLVRFEWVLLAYQRSSPSGTYLVVYDCWGSKYTYPFAVGEQQVFRPEIVLDKIKKHAPGCQIGCSAQHLAYVRSHIRPLPPAN